MCERSSLHSAIEIQSSNTAHSLPWYKFTLCISRVHHFMDHIVPVRVFILKARTFTTIFNYQVYYLWWHLQNIYRVCVYACVCSAIKWRYKCYHVKVSNKSLALSKSPRVYTCGIYIRVSVNFQADFFMQILCEILFLP